MPSHMYQEACASPEQVAQLLACDEAAYQALGAQLRARPPRAVVTVARGSSDHAASYLAYLVMARLGRLVSSLPLSLLTLYRAPLAQAGMLAVAVSQSGQSPDLVDTMQAFALAGATTVALVNVPASPLAQAVRWALPLHAGPEHSVAATKSFVCALVAAARLAAVWGGHGDLAAGL